jgi:hypothetical protein
MHTNFWYENLKEADHLEDLRVDGITLKSILKEYNERVVDWIH